MKVHQLYSFWRHFGADCLIYRTGYAARILLGLVRRKLPAANWEAQPLEAFLSDPGLAQPQGYLDYRRAQAPAFFFNPASRQQYQNYFAAWDNQAAVAPIQVSEQLAQGEMCYFEHTIAHTGFP